MRGFIHRFPGRRIAIGTGTKRDPLQGVHRFGQRFIFQSSLADHLEVKGAKRPGVDVPNNGVLAIQLIGLQRAFAVFELTIVVEFQPDGPVAEPVGDIHFQQAGITGLRQHFEF